MKKDIIYTKAKMINMHGFGDGNQSIIVTS